MDMKWLQGQFPDLANLVALVPSGQKLVYTADHKTEGPVMLKLYNPGSDVERIKREIAAPQKVKSARVPKVAELGVLKPATGEIVWLREKRVAGANLREVLAAKGKLDAAASIRIALHVIEVLAAAEAAGVVHRDIKPANIIVAPDGGAWVIDFGLARHLDLVSVTPSGDKLAACTPGYAPIEQFNNQKRDIDGRADLFAIGVTIYECVEGVNPYLVNAKDWKEILDRVTNKKLPRIATKGLPDGFVDLVEAMTRTKPEHRPSSVADALEWIREIAAVEKIA